MALKEKKGSGAPWAALEREAKSADKPNQAKSWNTKKNRKPGDTLIGTVGKTQDTVTAYGPGQVMRIVRPDGAEEGVFLSSVLKGAIASVGGFAEGDRVYIKVLGVPEGKRYQTYAVGKLSANGKK